jgi:hypothetical protein
VNFGSAYVDNCGPLDDSVSCTGGGSPRWSIPINTDRNGKVEGYAFHRRARMWKHGRRQTTSATCAVMFEGTTYANWDAFATANPDYGIGRAIPFVITDTTEPGTTLVIAIDVSK